MCNGHVPFILVVCLPPQTAVARLVVPTLYLLVEDALSLK